MAEPGIGRSGLAQPGRLLLAIIVVAARPSATEAADAGPATLPVASPTEAWRRWDHALTSSRDYDNPYADVVVQVSYRGPGGRTLQSYGFWDGGRTFRLRCAFPVPGKWHWRTTCSDAANTGLHQQHGDVDVVAYGGENDLYRRGFLAVGATGRYLCYGDGTPFFWLGDTAWGGPLRASDDEWDEYIADRKAKHFTVIQVAPAPRFAAEADRRGEKPFTDKTLSQWNPAFWQSFERKIERANEQGLVVVLVGLMEPVERYPDQQAACLFARNIVARLFGNFVVFSPSFDSPFTPLADAVGRAAREATAVHLITQHPGTPSREPIPTWSLEYYDRDYLDFAGMQSGHNGGDRARCAHHAMEWVLQLYRHEPHKPVINLEAMYDGRGEKAWQAADARSLAWRSWLSGAMGYTYGAGDVPPKCPQGSGGIWRWVTEPEKYDYWRKAIHWESALQMKYLHDFLAAIPWWTLEPAPAAIRNQPDDVTRRMVLARTAGGEIGVAYLPANDAIEIDLAALGNGPLGGHMARWFNPLSGSFQEAGRVPVGARHWRRAVPTPGDWVLLLEREKPHP